MKNLLHRFFAARAMRKLQEEELLAERLYEIWRAEYVKGPVKEQATWVQMRWGAACSSALQEDRNGWLAAARWILRGNQK